MSAARRHGIAAVEQAARGFVAEAMLERVTALYGARPAVEYVAIAGLVDTR